MMTMQEIETATRDQLISELAAAHEYTEDADACDLGELQARVRRLVRLYAEPLTDDDKRLLGTLCTRDESGRHFTETHSAEWLNRMEDAGIITISRPTHPATGIPYSQEYWSVGIMPNVPGITDEHGWLTLAVED